MKISNDDIRHRIYKLNESYSGNNYNEYIHEEAYKTTKLTAIRESMKSYISSILSTDNIDDAESYFDNMLNLYEKVCENYEKPSPEIDTCIHYLTEAIDRVRTPKEMQTLLKKRIAFGTKTRGVTKLKSNMEDISAKGVKANHNTDQLKGNDKLITKIEIPKLNVPQPAAAAKTHTEDVFTIDIYHKLIDLCEKNMEIDRIVTNFNELSRRFNIAKVFDEIKDDVTAGIDTYCELFDTWTDEQMSRKSKFNVAIETALFVNEKYNMGIDRETLIESIVDYHLFKNIDYDFIYSYLENNTSMSEQDLIPYTEAYNRIHKIEQDEDIASIIEAESKNPDKNTKSSIGDFKKSNDKSPQKFKDVLTKAYTKNPDQIINDTPKVFDITRFFIMVGTTAINPILGIITFFSDQFMKRKYSRKETEKMIDKYAKEIDKVQKKIKKCENEEKKKRLKDYKKTLEENLYKLQDYEKEMYTDKEYEDIENKRAEKSGGGDDDFDFDFNFDEAATILNTAEYAMNLNPKIVENCISKHISKLTASGLIDDITDFLVESEDFVNIQKIKGIYETHYFALKKENKKDYVAIDTIKNNIDKLSQIQESDSDEEYNCINRMLGYITFTETMAMIDDELSSPFLVETSFNNTFNIIKNKIQAAFATMSDKEKEFSARMDTSLSGFKSSVESYFKTSSRESVLKGQILPKASTILKTALGFGLVAWLINPIVSVIGLLGYIGVSKFATIKERQAIIDEIDIELQMVDKYLEKADQQGDLKATKNLLKTKKRLQKERLRIKYKMKMHGEKLDPGDLDKK